MGDTEDVRMKRRPFKTLAEIEKEAILQSLSRHYYDLSAVVKELAISKYALYTKLIEHKIQKKKVDVSMN